MSAQKTNAARKHFRRLPADLNLGASRVSHQRARLRAFRNPRQRFEDSPDRQRDVHQLRIANRLIETRSNLLNRSALERAMHDFRAVESNHSNGREVFSKRQCERTANQAGANNRHSS